MKVRNPRNVLWDNSGSVTPIEVESFIEDAVDEALLASPSTLLHRELLINSFVQALEKDASWVQMYGITGELIVPDLPRSDDAVAEEAMSSAAKVNRISCPFYTC